MHKLFFTLSSAGALLLLGACQSEKETHTAPVPVVKQAEVEQPKTAVRTQLNASSVTKSILVGGDKLTYKAPLKTGSRVYNQSIKQHGRVTGIITLVIHGEAPPSAVNLGLIKLADHTYQIRVSQETEIETVLGSLQAEPGIAEVELGVDYSPQSDRPVY